MTAVQNTPAEAAEHDLVSLTIDGLQVSVPAGTLVIRAAEQLGIHVPRFCDHPLLDPVGACRQCIVEIEGQRKPLASCTIAVTEGMVVHTQLSSPIAKKSQEGVLELLLINHPLDCPVCDKGGECPLQNQSMSNGHGTSRFQDVKRTFPKPLPISSQVLLDRERCVLCARCTRFSQQIAGDPFIEMFERGALQQVAIYADEPFESYFSGNTIQICPVGALTSAAYRFRARPFDLVSSPSVCEHCADGCALRTDHRRDKVTRRLAGNDPQVNEEWNCDKGRFGFTYAQQADRLTTPLVRDAHTGRLVEASWSEALTAAAAGLRERRTGVLPGGRSTVEDAYAYAKFARALLATNDIDARTRVHSEEELAFLASSVAGRYLQVSYHDIERAPAVLLAGLEVEEESPILFLRLRKAAQRGCQVFALAPFASPGSVKASARLLQTTPGREGEVLAALTGAAKQDHDEQDDDQGSDIAGTDIVEASVALRLPGSVIAVGERLAGSPGALSAVAALARATGAALAWIPRRAGERGAVDVGALPTLLPGGRVVTEAAARAEVEQLWGPVPAAPGRPLDAILAAARDGELEALLVGGFDPADCPDPGLALDALDRVGFLVSLEIRRSAVTDRADVVFPVAAVVEKAGTFLNWEGRARPFEQVLGTSGQLTDGRVLHALADQLGTDLGLADVAAARAEIGRLGVTTTRPTAPTIGPAAPPVVGAGQAVLATWKQMLDGGSLLDGEPHLAGTAKKPCLHLSAATAAELGAADGEPITLTSARGSLTLPLVVADLPDRVVWVPTRTPQTGVLTDLVAAAGDVVDVAKGANQ